MTFLGSVSDCSVVLKATLCAAAPATKTRLIEREMTNTELADRIAKAKGKDLIAYMATLGYEPETDTGSMAIYYSPFRAEGKASFVVHKRKNTFMDFGDRAVKGDVIDFVMQHEKVNLPKALDIILNGEAVSAHTFDREKNNNPAIVIRRVGTIISPELIVYLSQRKISPLIAQKYLKEVMFRFPYGKFPEKDYVALGFQTDSGGYEIRSRFFKICSPPKSITTLKGKSSDVVLYEGFMDFLSHQTKYGDLGSKTVIVLNTLSFLPAVIPTLKGRKVYSYIDKDKAGDDATELMREEGVGVVDCRINFIGYKDINDQLTDGKLSKV
jgi:DNA primase